MDNGPIQGLEKANVWEDPGHPQVFQVRVINDHRNGGCSPNDDDEEPDKGS